MPFLLQHMLRKHKRAKKTNKTSIIFKFRALEFILVELDHSEFRSWLTLD